MPLLILWDIDHTLIENSGVSKEIYAAAFASVIGHPPHAPVRTGGRTDRAIMSDLFRRNGLAEPGWETTRQALTEAGAAHFEALQSRGWALPGARSALEAVDRELGMISSVLTGNIAPNARVKLAAFGLDDLVNLSIGAYGADSVDRFSLVGTALARARTALGLLGDTPVVLIGDTPRDVEAALLTGSHVIAVATGIHTVQELSKAGADHVLDDLTGTGALLDHLRDLRAHS
ncbi:HAD family hydrolase [Nocardiopsis sp. NPDC050513]|uniref:HAD family hydrolase n=1 Tax=Nocardiopsis sp. NPDC050513 TaxID=3364338 RepID=UPI0037972DC4